MFQPQAFEIDTHLLAGEGVERAERLVHQQQARLQQQRAGDRRALAHAARQFVRIARGEVLQPHRLQQLHRLGAERGLVGAGHFRRKQHVVDDGAPGQQHMVLKHDAHVGRRLVAGVAEHRDLAGGCGGQPRNQPHQGRFAAARGADHGDEFPVGNRKIHLLQGPHRRLGLAKRLAHAPEEKAGRQLLSNHGLHLMSSRMALDGISFYMEQCSKIR